MISLAAAVSALSCIHRVYSATAAVQLYSIISSNGTRSGCTRLFAEYTPAAVLLLLLASAACCCVQGPVLQRLRKGTSRYLFFLYQVLVGGFLQSKS